MIVIGLYTFLWGKTKQMKETAMVLPVNVSSDAAEVVAAVEIEVEAKDKAEETKVEKCEKDEDEEHFNNKEDHVVVSIASLITKNTFYP